MDSLLKSVMDICNLWEPTILTILGQSSSKNEWKDSGVELEVDVEGWAMMLLVQRIVSRIKLNEGTTVSELPEENGTTDIELLWQTFEWSVQSLLSHSASIPESMDVILNSQTKKWFDKNIYPWKVENTGDFVHPLTLFDLQKLRDF